MGKAPNNKGRGRVKEVKEFDEEIIQIDRVTRVVKGGRRLRFRATVAIGNHKGRIGVGIGKSNEVAGAIKKAVAKAKKDMIDITIVNGTITHAIKTKFKSAKILLMPAAPGTGIIAGGAVRKVVNLSGIKNLLGKSIGSNNRLNNTKATFQALGLLRENPTIKVVEEKKEIVEAKKEDKPVPKGKPAEKGIAPKKADFKKPEPKKNPVPKKPEPAKK